MTDAPAVHIRPLREDDIPDMIAMTDDPKIERISLFVRQRERDQSKEEVFRGLIRLNEGRSFVTYTILDGDARVGCVCRISGGAEPHKISLGCWVAASRRGEGIAKAAFRQIIDGARADEEAGGIKNIFTAAVAPDNAESLALIKSLGFLEADHPANAPKSAMAVKHFILAQ